MKSVVKMTIGDQANSRPAPAPWSTQTGSSPPPAASPRTPGTRSRRRQARAEVLATLTNGRAVEVVDLVPRTDRDLVLPAWPPPATGHPAVRLALATAPAAGNDLTAAGFGRTKTEWVPGKLHTGTFTPTPPTPPALTLTGKGTDAVCKGDTGGPLLNAAGQLVAINSRSWQGGCLGTPATETRTGAISARADNLSVWSAEVRSLTPGWKTEAVVQAGTSLYQGIRLADGSWTGFTDVQSKAGNIGGIRTAAVAGIDGDTHVVALGTNGRIYHTIRKADGTWGTFGDVGGEAGVGSQRHPGVRRLHRQRDPGGRGLQRQGLPHRAPRERHWSPSVTSPP